MEQEHRCNMSLNKKVAQLVYATNSVSRSMKYCAIRRRASTIILTNETGFVRQGHSVTDKSRRALQYGQNNALSCSTVMDEQFQAEDTQQMGNVLNVVQPSF
jgi:hypothetical protein